MNILQIIKTRRSVRKFKRETVPSKVIERVLEAGRWAPSGLNNQPWKFLVLDGEKKDALASYTHYASIVKSADKVILVFLDKEASYHYEKDLMAVGACVQNMLLYIHARKLGACWLGEILKQRAAINRDLKIAAGLELAAVLAVGKPLAAAGAGSRKALKKLVL